MNLKQRKGLLKSSDLGEQQKFGLICDDETFSFTLLHLRSDIFYGQGITSNMSLIIHSAFRQSYLKEDDGWYDN